MPITGDEFEAGSTAASTDETEPSPIEDEKQLIVAFLSERHEQAFTEREIVLGVDFSPLFEQEIGTSRSLTAATGGIVDGLLDISGDITASAVLVNDVDEALSALVEEGAVETSEVETDEGSVTYYRLAE